MDLTDAQWAILEPTFRPRPRPERRGRPWTDARAVLNGVLWVLRTGAPWHDLPRPLSAVPNLPSALSAVATVRPARSPLATPRRRSPRPRQDRSVRSLRRCHLRRGEKRGAAVGPTRRGKGTKIMAICDRHGLPLAVHVASASPYEPHLVPATLDARFLPDLPARLIGDRGYDSDASIRSSAISYGIEMIAPNRAAVAVARRTAVRCAATAAAGKSNGSSPGSTTPGASSPAGNIMSRTFSACCSSPVPASCSGIYETGSSFLSLPPCR